MDLAIKEACIAEAAGNVPVAAVIVLDGQVLATAASEVDSRKNRLAHAEMLALERVLSLQDRSDLSGCTLYATMEPCPMCLWAIHLARISRLVLGARHRDMGRVDLGRYAIEDLLDMTGQRLDLVTGVRTKECMAVRRRWSQRTGRLL